MSESFLGIVPGNQPHISQNAIPNIAGGANIIANQPLHQAPPQAPVDHAAENSLVKQLDVLLFHAAKKATTLVKTEAVGQVLDTLDLDNDLKDEILELADDIDKDLKTLAKYSGRDIADALKSVNGKFEWDDSKDAGEAMKNLIDGFSKYSQKLQDAINAHPGVKGLALLEEAMFQSDRRSSELTTLALQFADMSLEEKNSPEVKMKLDLELAELLPAQALKMHGNAEAIERMREKVAPLATRLDKLAQKPDTPVSMQELAMLKMEMSTMAKALELAMKEGFPSGDNGRFFADNSLLGEAKRILDALPSRFENARVSVAQASMKRVVSQGFKPLPSQTPFSKKSSPVLKVIAPALHEACRLHEKLREKAEAFANEPTEEAENELNALNAEYQTFCKTKLSSIQKDVVYLAKKLEDSLDIKASITQKIAQSNVPDKEEFTENQLDEMVNLIEILHNANEYAARRKHTISPTIQLLSLFSHPSSIGSQVCHLVGMKHSLDNLSTKKIVTSDSVRMAFSGTLSTSSLVEARIHGVKDEDVDTLKDDSRMISSRKLGSGNANTVFEVKYKDGSAYVFKPEVAGRIGINYLALGRNGYADQIQIAQINMCSQKTANLLGLDDVMVKTTLGSHKGNFGLFMEKAPGVSGFDFVFRPDEAPEDGLSMNDLKGLSEADYNKVLGQLKHQLNRLQWFDAITGQGDRHSSNYFIHVSKDLKVTVKAIDNDMSFTNSRIGLSTFKLTNLDKTFFLDEISNAQKKLFPKTNPPLQLLPDPGVTVNKEAIIVDVTKIKSSMLFSCLSQSFGFQPCSTRPQAIDQELYDRLMELESGDKRDAYVKELKGRLTQDAVDATLQRLDEAISHAKSLKKQDKVFKAEDFMNPDIQKQISVDGRQLKLGEQNGIDPLDTEEAKKETKKAEGIYKAYHCDLFHRDFATFMEQKIVPVQNA